MRISILGCGNVGCAYAADLTRKGHEVSMIKTSNAKSKYLADVRSKGIALFENGTMARMAIHKVTAELACLAESDVVIITVQSSYQEELIKRMSRFLGGGQLVIVICSYLSNFFFKKHVDTFPTLVETTGPYLEGRLIDGDIPTFHVGCRLSSSPVSVINPRIKTMDALRSIDGGFSVKYSPLESGLLNPNMILHTVGAIMSIPRVEYSQGNFCMYREAYSRRNEATMRIMYALDEEKKSVLARLGCRPVGILDAAGFSGNLEESFHRYAESEERAKSPSSVKSRYITEDVSQGLVLLESIAKRIGLQTPVASALITIAGSALGTDFRATGRTVERLGCGGFIDSCANGTES